mmetsp:Transcript_32775/g.94123  ORF Transcript_32775/g.94123 Transcript_32775/m.94123 type:complete len:289 (-) Transcript_32775:174-1040(-)
MPHPARLSPAVPLEQIHKQAHERPLEDLRRLAEEDLEELHDDSVVVPRAHVDLQLQGLVIERLDPFQDLLRCLLLASCQRVVHKLGEVGLSEEDVGPPLLAAAVAVEELGHALLDSGVIQHRRQLQITLRLLRRLVPGTAGAAAGGVASRGPRDHQGLDDEALLFSHLGKQLMRKLASKGSERSEAIRTALQELGHGPRGAGLHGAELLAEVAQELGEVAYAQMTSAVRVPQAAGKESKLGHQAMQGLLPVRGEVGGPVDDLPWPQALQLPPGTAYEVLERQAGVEDI